MPAHSTHACGEGLDTGEQAGAQQVVHHLLAINDGVQILQVGVEKGREVIFLAVRGDSVDHLAEVQILEAGWGRDSQGRSPRPREENALELGPNAGVRRCDRGIAGKRLRC
ncbi:hypothetical protein D3C80_1674240 [compost metagenome]